MYTDDPVRDAMHRDQQQQEWLARLPRCAHCHEHIQDETYYEIEGDNVHSDCIADYCDEHYKVFNTEL